MWIAGISPVRTQAYALLRDIPSSAAISVTVQVSGDRIASMVSIIHIAFPVTFPVWFPIRADRPFLSGDSPQRRVPVPE
jgi:hypothetical protein